MQSRRLLLFFFPFLILVSHCRFAPPLLSNEEAEAVIQNASATPAVTEPAAPNQPPVADIELPNGSTYLITETTEIQLNGKGSYDPERSALTYNWSVINEGVNPDFQPLDNAFSEMALGADNNLEPGIYYFMLYVNDGTMLSAPVKVKVEILVPDAEVGPGRQYTTIMAAINNAVDIDNDNKIIIVVDYAVYTEQLSIGSDYHIIGKKSTTGLLPAVNWQVNKGESTISLGKNSRLENIHAYNQYKVVEEGETIISSVITVTGIDASLKNCLISPIEPEQEISDTDGINIAENSSAVIDRITIDGIHGEGIESLDNAELYCTNSVIMNTGGTALWGKFHSILTIYNCLIEHSGWHGVDLNDCSQASVEHCSIIDFSYDNFGSNQSGIYISSSTDCTIKNNLISIRNVDEQQESFIIYGAFKTNAGGEQVFLYNSIFSFQDTPYYFGGDFSSVPENNFVFSTDPCFENKAEHKFLLMPVSGSQPAAVVSPAKGLGENGVDPGIISNPGWR